MPTALITGASTGIGQATALRLAKAGWTVLAGVRHPDAGERTSPKAPAGRVQPLILDVTDLQQIVQAAARVSELGGGGESSPGRLDALVNNAGVGYGGPLELIHPDDLRTQFDVNVLGQVSVTQALLPALRARRTHDRLPVRRRARGDGFHRPSHAASKHAIEAIGDALRVELATSNVQVALIEPGSVSTPIWDKARETGEQITVPPELAAGRPGTCPRRWTRRLPGHRRAASRRAGRRDDRARARRGAMQGSRYVVGRDGRAR